jgi:hypothetical protein
LAAASHYEKPIELLEQILRRSFVVLQIFSFRPSNLSLDTIFVKVVKQLLRGLA